MGLKAAPDFRLTVGDQDATATIRDRLTTLSVIDNSGEESDTLEIVLDDRGNTIESPRRGAVLSLFLGYEGDGLIYMGRFTVDETEVSGPPDILTIRAKAADMREGLKAQKTRAFDATTIGAIVAQIADEHGLRAAVAAGLAGRAIQHRDQTNESDLHFLTRLGRDFGAVAAPKDGRLVFAPASSGLTASGDTLEAVNLTRGDLTTWRSVAADREAQGSVRARYRDLSAAATRYETAGSGSPARTLRNTYRDQAAARAAAEAELARSKRAANDIELVLPGRAALVAQTPIVVSGLRSELTGRWIADRVEHRLEFEGAGFTTTLTGSKA